MSSTNFIQYGPKDSSTLDIPLGEFVINQLKTHGDRVAQILYDDGVETQQTFSEILLYSRGVVRLLREHNVGIGDTVMIASLNNLEFAPLMTGALTLGVACCPVIPHYETDEFVHLLKVCEPRIVFCDTTSLPKMQEAASQRGPNPPVVIPLAELRKRFLDPENKIEIQPTPIADHGNHVACIMTSSGTTGLPKGVEVTQSSLFNIINSQRQPAGIVGICPIPFFWVTGMGVNFVGMCTGAKCIFLPNFELKSFCEAVQKYKAKYTCLAVAHMIALTKFLPKNKMYDLSSLAIVTCGGVKASVEQFEQAEKQIGTRVTQTYGMTEALRMLKPVYTRRDKPGSVGTADTNYAIKVVDIDTREILGPSCTGEVCFRGPTLLKGYRGDPEATRLLFDEDGFVQSGDIGYYDEEGYFYIVERIKDHIKYLSSQLPSVVIESAILEHPDVLEASVVGIPHDEDTERTTAYVVRKPGARVTEDEIVEFVKGKLSVMKWLHGGVYFIDQLPMTFTGKVKKHILRSQHEVYKSNYIRQQKSIDVNLIKNLKSCCLGSENNLIL